MKFLTLIPQQVYCFLQEKMTTCCQHANPNNKILSPGNIFLFFEGKRYKTNDNDMSDRFTNILKVLFDGNKWILKLTISCSCLPFEEVSKI